MDTSGRFRGCIDVFSHLTDGDGRRAERDARRLRYPQADLAIE